MISTLRLNFSTGLKRKLSSSNKVFSLIQQWSRNLVLSLFNVLKDRLRKIINLTSVFPDLFLKVANMAGFQYHRSDDFLNDAFACLANGFYFEAIAGFQELISRIEFKLNHVEGDQFGETLCVLGKLRRGLAEALWHIDRPQHALELIQLCISENCHEFSEVSDITQLSLAVADLLVFKGQGGLVSLVLWRL